MKILTLDNNEPYNLENLPEEIDDLRFAILDNSNPHAVDYHYIPLIFLESFKPHGSNLFIFSTINKKVNYLIGSNL